MKIRHKIYSIVLINLIALSIIITLGFQALEKTEQAFTRLQTNEMHLLTLIVELKERLSTFEHFILSNAITRDDNRNILKDISHSFQEAKESLHQLKSFAEAQQDSKLTVLASDLLVKTDNFHRIGMQIKEEFAYEYEAGLVTLYGLNDLKQVMQDNFNLLLTHAMQQFQQKQQSLHHENQQTKQWIYLLGFSTLIVVLILSIWISRRITSAIGVIQQGLQNFFAFVNRRHNNVQPIQIDTQDELGMMAQTINTNIQESQANIRQDLLAVHATIDTAHQIASGDYAARNAEQPFTPELSELNRAFNEMLDNLVEKQRFIEQKEGLLYKSDYVDTIIQELSEPFSKAVMASSNVESTIRSVIVKYNQQTLKKSDMDDFLENISLNSTAVHSNLEKADESLQLYFSLFPQNVHKKECFSIHKHISTIIFGLKLESDNANVAIEIEGDSDLQVISYQDAFTHIFTALFLNSIHHAFEGLDEAATPKVTITFETVENSLQVIYRDNGPGIDKSIRNMVFNLFFTTKKEKGFVGLGLHVVKKSVEERLEGIISLNEHLGQTEFVVQIPNCIPCPS